MKALGRAAAAEVVRTRRTLQARAWLLALLVAGLQCGGWLVASRQALSDWQSLLMWQVFYATGLAGALAALLGALGVRREQATRAGGTLWRAPQPAVIRGAQLAVLAAHLGVFTLALTMPMVPFGIAWGLDGAPVGRFVALTGLLWLGALPWLCWGVFICRRLGLYAAAGSALVLHVVGTIRAEESSWWLEPWTWGVRAALPLLQTHANGVPARPGEAVLDVPVGVMSTLTLAWTLILAVVAIWMPERVRRQKAGAEDSAAPAVVLRQASSGAINGTPNLLAAAWLAWPRRWVWSISAAALGLLALVRLLWRPMVVHGFWALLVIPGVTCLMACLQASWQRPALRVVLTRVSARRWAACQLVMVAAALAPVVVLGALASDAGGATVVVGVTSAATLTLFALWLATRFGTGVALGVCVVGTMWSILVGGSILADGVLWLLAPWAWPYAGVAGGRWLVASAISLVSAAGWSVLWVRATRRAGSE